LLDSKVFLDKCFFMGKQEGFTPTDYI
jgi:hypothetical protein